MDMEALKLVPKLIATLLFSYAPLNQAEEAHSQEAMKHLEQAVESGKKGSAEAAGQHATEAKEHAIQQNQKSPYKQSQKRITGENAIQQHDEEAFKDIDKSKSHANKGHAEESGKSASQAKDHLKDKEKAK